MLYQVFEPDSFWRSSIIYETTKEKAQVKSMNHLLAACFAYLWPDPGAAIIRIRLLGSRDIGTSILAEFGLGIPQVRLRYTLLIVCSLNCSAN
jgi:hypothetical protein